MKKNNIKYVLAGLVVLGLVSYGASLYIQMQQSEYVSMIKVLISDQEKKLISLAEVTDRNGADEITDEIIKDCIPQYRQRFDELLGTLDELSYEELNEVDRLFDTCGNFYAQRKSLMTTRLNQEFEVYNNYVQLIRIIDSRAQSFIYPIEKWEELVALELQRSDLSSQLVVIQKNIILALLDGVSVQSEQILQETTKAQEINDTLSYTGVKIDKLREDIIGL